jgi:6-phosphogluconolactonase
VTGLWRGDSRVAIEVGADHEANSQRAAELVAEALQESGGGRFALVIPGGSTPTRLFDLLSEGFPSALPWERVHLFWSDERCVPPEHPESNYGGARRLLIERLALPADRLHRMRGEAGAGTGAADYRRELARFFGDGLPAFDLAVLGLGHDAHTCSLFPGSPALGSGRAVEPARSPAGVAKRITLTPAAFRRAARVLFLVSGAEKAEAVARSLEGDGNPSWLPARAIRPERGLTRWLLDRAAAANLERAGAAG